MLLLLEVGGGTNAVTTLISLFDMATRHLAISRVHGVYAWVLLINFLISYFLNFRQLPDSTVGGGWDLLAPWGPVPRIDIFNQKYLRSPNLYLRGLRGKSPIEARS